LKKILFIAHHRKNRAPGQRYRFEQYFNYLESNNIKCELAYWINENNDKTLYHKGRYVSKLFLAVKAYIVRISNLLNINKYDLIVVFREALPTRSIFFERCIYWAKIPMIYDFDDAIWVKDVSNVNKRLSWFKNEKKIEKLLSLCSHVTCGNSYLADFAKKFNQNISVIPSTVDTSHYVPFNNKYDEVRIGWVGSHTTIKHFELITDVFIELKNKYEDKVKFVVIGDESYTNKKLNLKGIRWDNEKEVELFNSFDIGIMPLPKDEWTKGKCGMKGLLYMSVGKPTVMSCVGMNKEIIDHGVNGFLPIGHQQWLNVLSKLIENQDLRDKIGREGRRTVESKYSKEKIKTSYLNLYNSLMK
tara:strand:+ start:8633 stop:9709 length:1077 start_codon:yes stop_codon:yes gene_type:complete